MKKDEFKRRRDAIVRVLPRCYGVVARIKHPEISVTALYNFVGKGTYNVDALLALEDSFSHLLGNQPNN